MVKDKSTKYIFLTFITTSLVVFFLHSLLTKTSVFADAKFYYSYTRSFVFDNNLLLGNEFFNLGLLEKVPHNQFAPIFYPPGVSIFWVPLFQITFGFTNLIKAIIPNLKISGFEPIFEYSAALTSIFLGISSLFLVFKIISQYFSEKVSLLTVTALFFATNLFFYIAVEPINSHAASFFVSTLFVVYFLTRKKDGLYYIILGLIGGVAGLVRTQDLLILSIPIIQIILNYRRSLRTLISFILLLTVGCFIGFSPQILLWKYFYNTFWYSPYFDVGFAFLKPQILHVLFNYQNGLFTVTPVVAIAFIGILLKFISKLELRKWIVENNIFVYALFYFLLQLYLVSSWKEYTQGGSYSIRMMLTTYPLMSFGLAEITEKVIKKIGDKKTIYIIGGFSILNFFSILNYLMKY
jgi:Dolichyl-phosphate-mannose-protein mannosyltransferase